MENAALFSPSDISTIRRYVQTKYEPLPGDRRAEIVAEAIRRTLRQRLPDVPDEWKSRMIDRLIANCLLREQREVKPDDVLDLLAEIDGEQTDYGIQLLESIHHWANSYSPGRWSLEQLATRLNRGAALNVAAESFFVPSPKEWPASRPEPSERPFAIPMPWLRKPVFVPTVLLAFFVLSGGIVGSLWIQERLDKPVSIEKPETPFALETSASQPDIGMPEQLRFHEIDVLALKTYLNSRNSLLAEASYFNTIMDSAREHDIHPLLLFAITGQEQGFVPKTGKHAKRIANNPFNVGHSWMAYNTNIRDSADIASRLIAKLGKNRPEGYDPFAWFNKTYAEDPLWSEGVRKIFDRLSGLPLSVDTNKAK